MQLKQMLLRVCLISAVMGMSGQTAPQPAPVKFTIGKATTIVDGPLNRDGTVNYIPALNAIMGQGVKNEENAAIPLLMLSLENVPTEKEKLIFAALDVSIPSAKSDRLTYFQSYISSKQGANKTIQSDEEQTKSYESEQRTREYPWKAPENQNIADWLIFSEPGIRILEEACKRPHYFVPFVATKDPPSALQGMPFFSAYVPRDVLASRAMLRAGSGNALGALDDLRRIRVLARFAEQTHEGISHLQALAFEISALKGYSGMATSGTLDKAGLESLRKEIQAMPQLSQDDPIRDQVEEMIALDLIMTCIRGDSESIMRLMALDFSQSKHIDLGDWSTVDWDIVLKEVRRLCATKADTSNNIFSQKLEALTKKAEADKARGVPQMLDSLAEGDLTSGPSRVEAFLKIRPGETKEEFARRVTAWLVGVSPSDQRRSLFLDERERMMREMCLLTVRLAEHRVANGTFPSSLEQLGKPVLQDSFSAKEIQYRVSNGGFTIWSVGFNQKDDGATKDDLVLKSSQQP